MLFECLWKRDEGAFSVVEKFVRFERTLYCQQQFYVSTKTSSRTEAAQGAAILKFLIPLLTKSLKVLHAAGNTIEFLPDNFNLNKLEKLYLGRNCFRKFPSNLYCCPFLDTIDLSANKIEEITIEQEFPHLQELVLSHNELASLKFRVSALKSFPCLVSLDISCNPLLDIPEVGEIKTLEFINVLQCNITKLSRKQTAQFAHISVIYMQGNPLGQLSRPLRVSFVEKNTDLLMSDFRKSASALAIVANTSQKIPLAECSSEDKDFTISWSEIKGSRTTQEDTMSLRNDDNMKLFAVFDGHRASSTSKFCAVNFAPMLRQNFQKDLDPRKAIEATFEELSLNIGEQKFTDGSTVGMALITEDTICLAHLGDARVVLFQKCSSNGKEDDASDTGS